MKRLAMLCLVLIVALVSPGCSFLPAVFLLGVGVMGPSVGDVTEIREPVAVAVAVEPLEDGVPSHGSVLGESGAPVTLVVFTDFACPHCQVYQPTIDQFIEAHVQTGHARLDLRILPTAGGRLTDLAGRYAHCADRIQSGRFWAAANVLHELATSGQYDDSMGRQIADRLGLDYIKLLDCVSTNDDIQQNIALAGSLGVAGTPALRIRYGDADPVVISHDGRDYEGGGIPFEVLDAVVMAAQVS